MGLAKLCGWLGISRQAYYQNTWKAIDTAIEQELVLQEVKSIRKSHPRLGTRKLYEKLQSFLLGNAIAERVNGIIKEEYLDNYQISNVSQANDLLNTVIRLYNKDRPHMSISNLTPDKVHYAKNKIKTEKLWKNYYQKNSLFVK
jgi:transposase InsO family protein